RYWRVGTQDGSTEHSFWDLMREKSVVAIGWHVLGDLSRYIEDDGRKELLKQAFATAYPGTIPTARGRAVQQILHFCHTMEEGDYVVPCEGAAVLGVGRVAGPY